MLARVRALLRRPKQDIGTSYIVADLTLDTSTKEVTRSGKTIPLSSKEFAILHYLMRNKDRIVSKASITTHAWDFDADILPNTVEVFINYLRSKVDKPFDTPLIHTVRGFGYKISDTS